MALADTESRDDALASFAIGLGTMKAVDLAEELMLAARISPPKWSKSLLAVGLAIGATTTTGRGGWRRRALVAAAASGTAALLHSAERLARYSADGAAVVVVDRLSLRRPQQRL